MDKLTRLPPGAFSTTSYDTQVLSPSLLRAAARAGTLPLAPYPPGAYTNGYIVGPAGKLLPPAPDEQAIIAKADRQLAGVHLDLDWRFWIGLSAGALGLYWLGRSR